MSILGAIAPSPDCMVAAAVSDLEFSEIAVVGANAIFTRLKEWKKTDVAEIHIFQELVSNPAQLIAELAGAAKRGRKIFWYCSEKYVKKLTDLKMPNHVTVLHGETVCQAFHRARPIHKAYRKLVKSSDSWQGDLMNFTRYVISRSYMESLQPDSYHMMIRELRTFKDKEFAIKGLTPEINGAVKAFIEANSPLVEGRSPQIVELKKDILSIGKTDLSTLIIGETGTGKELAAFFIHDFSRRRGKPYVALNCAGLSEDLLRSELFGHVKGAFTGALADKEGLITHAAGGTLFLDEIGDMAPQIQADLLRFLQSKSYRPVGKNEQQVADVRLIAATQPSIFEKMENGSFRRDLYYRIAEIEITTPPLRMIPEDIIRIVRHTLFHLLRKDRSDINHALQYFAQNEEILKKYPWPGNTRELISLIKRNLYLRRDVAKTLQESIRDGAKSSGKSGSGLIGPISKIFSLEDVKRMYLQKVRKTFPGIPQKDLIARLEISPNTFKKYLGSD